MTKTRNATPAALRRIREQWAIYRRIRLQKIAYTSYNHWWNCANEVNPLLMRHSHPLPLLSFFFFTYPKEVTKTSLPFFFLTTFVFFFFCMRVCVFEPILRGNAPPLQRLRHTSCCGVTDGSHFKISYDLTCLSLPSLRQISLSMTSFQVIVRHGLLQLPQSLSFKGNFCFIWGRTCSHHHIMSSVVSHFSDLLMYHVSNIHWSETQPHDINWHVHFHCDWTWLEIFQTMSKYLQ